MDDTLKELEFCVSYIDDSLVAYLPEGAQIVIKMDQKSLVVESRTSQLLTRFAIVVIFRSLRRKLSTYPGKRTPLQRHYLGWLIRNSQLASNLATWCSIRWWLIVHHPWILELLPSKAQALVWYIAFDIQVSHSWEHDVVLISLRNSVKEDLGRSLAKLVFGTSMWLSSERFVDSSKNISHYEFFNSLRQTCDKFSTRSCP